MTCRELTDFLADYLSDELPAPQRDEFEHHLAVCSACRRYLASYRATIEMGKVALKPTDEDASAQVPEDLLQAILEARKRA